MGCLSIFNPLRLLILSLSFFFPFYLSSFYSCLLSLLFPFLFQIWKYERLRLLHPSIVPPSQYLPKHYRDRRLKRDEMSFEEFTKFMKHIDVIDIQWVVQWWHISGMVNRVFKDNYVPLVGICHCSYYFLDHIALPTLSKNQSRSSSFQ